MGNELFWLRTMLINQLNFIKTKKRELLRELEVNTYNSDLPELLVTLDESIVNIRGTISKQSTSKLLYIYHCYKQVHSLVAEEKSILNFVLFQILHTISVIILSLGIDPEVFETEYNKLYSK